MRSGIPQPGLPHELCAPFSAPSLLQLRPSAARCTLGDGRKSNKRVSRFLSTFDSQRQHPRSTAVFSRSSTPLRHCATPPLRHFAQEPPLCFHSLTKAFSRKHFPLIFLQNAEGYTPLVATRSANSAAAQASITFVSYSCALFCTLSKFNSPAFNYLRALSQKHPGGGTPHPEKIPKTGAGPPSVLADSPPHNSCYQAGRN